MNDSIPPLLPAIVVCCRQRIMAVQLPDGRVAGIVPSMCEPLQLDRTAQLRRIRRNESLARHLLLVPVLTNGGVQKMDALVASAIPRWLEGIQVSRLAPAKRPLARGLQRDLEEALNRHFSGEAAGEAIPHQPERPTVSSDAPAQMIANALETIGEAAHLIVGAVQMMGEAAQVIAADQQTLKERVAALEAQHAASQETQRAMGQHLVATREQHEAFKEEQRAMGVRLTAQEGQHEVAQEWQQALGDYLVETREQVTMLAQRLRVAPGATAGSAAPSDSGLLSPQHLAQLYGLAREERSRSGASVGGQVAALAEAFGVPDVSDLPDSAWQDVLTWFWERRQRR